MWGPGMNLAPATNTIMLTVIAFLTQGCVCVGAHVVCVCV